MLGCQLHKSNLNFLYRNKDCCIPRNLSSHLLQIHNKFQNENILILNEAKKKKFNFLTILTLNTKKDLEPKLKYRTDAIRKIKDFLIKFNFSWNSYFLAVFIFDLFFIDNSSHIPIYLLAITSIFIALKFCENEKEMPSLKCILSHYFNSNQNNDNNFSIRDIRQTEVVILKKMNYNLSFSIFFYFLKLFSFFKIAFTLPSDNNLIGITVAILENGYEYLLFDQFNLACAILAFFNKNRRNEKWSINLEQMLQIKFDAFEKEFNYIDKILRNYVSEHDRQDSNNSKNNNNNNLCINNNNSGNNSLFTIHNNDIKVNRNNLHRCFVNKNSNSIYSKSISLTKPQDTNPYLTTTKNDYFILSTSDSASEKKNYNHSIENEQQHERVLTTNAENNKYLYHSRSIINNENYKTIDVERHTSATKNKTKGLKIHEFNRILFVNDKAKNFSSRCLLPQSLSKINIHSNEKSSSRSKERNTVNINKVSVPKRRSKEINNLNISSNNTLNSIEKKDISSYLYKKYRRNLQFSIPSSKEKKPVPRNELRQQSQQRKNENSTSIYLIKEKQKTIKPDNNNNYYKKFQCKNSLKKDFSNENLSYKSSNNSAIKNIHQTQSIGYFNNVNRNNNLNLSSHKYIYRGESSNKNIQNRGNYLNLYPKTKNKTIIPPTQQHMFKNEDKSISSSNRTFSGKSWKTSSLMCNSNSGNTANTNYYANRRKECKVNY